MMSKVEKETLERLRRELATERARHVDPLEPDLPIPEGSGIVNGWLYHCYRGELRVGKSCSSCISHNFGDWDRTTTQRPIRQYSSRLRALIAGRAELALECARMLADADHQINQEFTTPQFQRRNNPDV